VGLGDAKLSTGGRVFGWPRRRFYAAASATSSTLACRARISRKEKSRCPTAVKLEPPSSSKSLRQPRREAAADSRPSSKAIRSRRSPRRASVRRAIVRSLLGLATLELPSYGASSGRKSSEPSSAHEHRLLFAALAARCGGQHRRSRRGRSPATRRGRVPYPPPPGSERSGAAHPPASGQTATGSYRPLSAVGGGSCPAHCRLPLSSSGASGSCGTPAPLVPDNVTLLGPESVSRAASLFQSAENGSFRGSGIIGRRVKVRATRHEPAHFQNTTSAETQNGDLTSDLSSASAVVLPATGRPWARRRASPWAATAVLGPLVTALTKGSLHARCSTWHRSDAGALLGVHQLETDGGS